MLCAVFFLYIARDKIEYTSDELYQIANVPEKDLDELTDGMTILQTFKSEHQYLNQVQGYFLTYGRTNKGTVHLQVLDMAKGTVLAESTVEASELGNGERCV